MNKLSINILLALLIAGCGGSNLFRDTGEELFSLSNLKSNLEFLASDELEGREATTRGEKIASQFIAAELQKYGVKPFGDDSTYFQNFPLKVINFDKDSKIIFNKNGQQTELQIGKDFGRISYSLPDSLGKIKNAPIIFSGYGLISPEHNHNDYDNIDVNDKVVLVLSGMPSYFGYSFNYQQTSQKISTAKSKGAAALLVIPNEYVINRWNRYKSWSTSTKFIYEAANEKIDEETIPAFVLSEQSAKLLLNNEEYSYNQLIEKSEKNNPLQQFQLNSKIDFDVVINVDYKSARNVVGIIEGTDESLKEYVSIGAHYDHEGIIDSVIYNGANDNASGTSALIEAAKALSLTGNNKRPVVVIFYSAEEKGLLGAKHFTSASSIINDVIVNINIDMLGSGSTDSLFSVGAGRLSKELYNLVNEVNNNNTKFIFDYKFDDTNDPQRIYYRSDHYQFAKRGIPSVFFTVEDLVNYHKPTDDAEHINFEKVLKVSRLVYYIALRIANLDYRLPVDVEELISN